MPGRDFSEYEKRRAEEHEVSWRLAATFDNIRSRHCRYRFCRRYQVCSGPMLVSDHQRGMVRAQIELGLSGTACASLPMCMAHATAEYYAEVGRVREQLMELRFTEFKGCTALETLDTIRAYISGHERRHAAHLTSEARQPTSDAEHEG